MNDQIEQEEKEINLKSEELCEIMGEIPNSIIRYGITIIFIIISSIILFSFIFKYPDIISGPFYIQSSNPPAFLLSHSNGKIDHLFVNEEETVKKGEILALLETATSYKSYVRLKKELKNISIPIDSIKEIDTIDKLGELQKSYSEVIQAANRVMEFNNLKYYDTKINLLKIRLSNHQKQDSLYHKKKNQFKEIFNLANIEFIRSEKLYNKEVISEVSRLKVKKEFIEAKQEMTAIELQRTSINNQILEIQSQILELQLNKKRQYQQACDTFTQSLENCKSQLAQWEKKYCIITPIDGKVSLSDVWNKNQNVRNNQLIMTIIPLFKNEILVKIKIPINRAGKIAPQQKVNLKFADYPFIEYGIVHGNLDKISAVADSTYTGTIKLGVSLKTDFKTELPFRQNMKGIAEIVTEEMSLAERICKPLHSILKEHLK